MSATPESECRRPRPRFSVLGRPLHARIASPGLSAWLDRLWCHEEHALDPHPHRIVVEEEASPAVDERTDWPSVDIRLPDGITLRWRTHRGVWIAGTRAGGVLARYDTREAHILVWGAADPPPDLYPALYVALCEAVRTSGLIPFHAAVAVRAGEATALAAPSGTGKTTTLLRLLDRGWRPLAEDLSWFEPDTRTVYGWDRGIRLWPEAIERSAPGLASAPWRADADGKALLDWDAVGVPRVPRAGLARVVLLERNDDRPSTIEPLPRHEAVRVLWEATGVPLTPSARTVLAARAGTLARGLAFARLRLGRTPIPAIDAAD